MNPLCPICEGVRIEWLGSMGTRNWWRCKHCGAVFSTAMEEF